MPKSSANASGPNPGLIALIVLAGVVVLALFAFSSKGSAGKEQASPTAAAPSNAAPATAAGAVSAVNGASNPGSAAFDATKLGPKPRH